MRPLPVIEPPDPKRVAELVDEHTVELIIVGLPVGLGGQEGAQARIARDFAEEIAAAVPVQVETYDERFTSAIAETSARAGARAAEDSLAAAHLLESYLASTEAR